MSYFSNHSASRFLTNSSQTANTTTTNAQTSASGGEGTPPSATPAAAGQQNPRRVPSKHFSTTVNPAQTVAAKDTTNSSPLSFVGTINVHPLRHTWVFWFRQQRAPGNKISNYEEGIKKITAFSSVESFWSLWTHLTPPSSLQPTTDYLLFHSGVRRPVWEDPLNLSGGKWIIRLKKGIADRFWEDLVISIIGDQFDGCRSNIQTSRTSGEGNRAEDAEAEAAEWPDICGCTISVRQHEDIVSVWNRVDVDVKVREQIRDTLRKFLNLSPSTIMEYKSNNDSMQDKSSFRRTNIDRVPLPSNS